MPFGAEPGRVGSSVLRCADMRRVLGCLLLLVAVPLGLLTLKILLFKLTSLDWYAYGVAAVYGLACAACASGGIHLLRGRSQASARSAS